MGNEVAFQRLHTEARRGVEGRMWVCEGTEMALKI